MNILPRKFLREFRFYLLAGSMLIILDVFGLLQRGTLFIHDSFLQLRQPSLNKNLVTVEIDDNTIKVVSSDPILSLRAGNLPERETLAKVIDTLVKLKAKAIVIDLMMDTSELSDSHSQLLANAGEPSVIHCIDFKKIKRHIDRVPEDRSIERFKFITDTTRYSGLNIWLYGVGLVKPYSELAKAASNLAHPKAWKDDIDGVVRRVPIALNYSQNSLPSLSLEALATYLEGYAVRVSNDHIAFKKGDSHYRLSFGESGLTKVNFLNVNAFENSQQKLPYESLLSPSTADSSKIKGKIVLIGSIAKGHDRHRTPLGNQYPGLYIHASVINSVLQNESLLDKPWLGIFAFLLLGMPFHFYLRKQQYHYILNRGSILTALLIVFVMVAGFATYLIGWLWDLSIPIFGIFSMYVFVLIASKRETRVLEKTFLNELKSYRLQVQDLEWELLNQSALLSRPKFIDSHILYSLDNNITRTSKLLESRSQDLQRLRAQYGIQGSVSISDDLTSEQGKLDKHSSTVSELTDKLEFVRGNIKEEKKELGMLMAEDSKDPSEIKTSIEAISKTLDDLEEKWQHGMMDNGQYFRMKVHYEKQKASFVDRLEKLGMDEKEVALDPTHKIFNEILIELRGMRGDLGSHFEAVLYRLDKNEQKEVQKMIGKADSLTEASEYLEPIRDSLIALSSAAKTQLERDKEVSVSLQQVIAKLQSKDDDKVSASTKLKYSLPIIPAILKLEGELDFGNLRKIWDKLKNKLLDA